MICPKNSRNEKSVAKGSSGNEALRDVTKGLCDALFLRCLTHTTLVQKQFSNTSLVPQWVFASCFANEVDE